MSSYTKLLKKRRKICTLAFIRTTDLTSLICFLLSLSTIDVRMNYIITPSVRLHYIFFYSHAHPHNFNAYINQETHKIL